MFGTVAGSPRHPDWYYNLLAHPQVQVEVSGDSFLATAILVNGRERERLNPQHAAEHPQWAQYLKMTSREIPVLALQRTP